MTGAGRETKITSKNPLKALHDEGQAVWLDFLARRFLADGGLKRLIEQDGLTGVTSNPSIFEKAIAESGDYETSLRNSENRADLGVMALYERLAIEDIRRAADELKPVFEQTGGADGYASIEVSPYLARDTEATVSEARRLAKAVDRPNVMVKVPATKEGLPAIRRLTADGLNVNITLLFSQQVYEEVVDAYLTGLEQFVAQGGDPSGVASVASFFVSRIDLAVDKIVEEQLRQTRRGKTSNSVCAPGKSRDCQCQAGISTVPASFCRHTLEKVASSWRPSSACVVGQHQHEDPGPP